MAHHMASFYTPEDVPGESVVHFAATVRISAPARYVFDILTQPATWSRWNTFMPSLEPLPARDDGFMGPGSRVRAGVRMRKGSALNYQELIVTGLEHERTDGVEVHRVCWKSDNYSSRTLRGLRTTECFSTGDDEESEDCVFRSWEWMAGPLSHAVKMLYKKQLQTRFEDMANDLKAYAEDTWVEKGWSEKTAQMVARTTEVSPDS